MEDRELILWSSFIHDLGKLLQRNEFLKIQEASHQKALSLFLSTNYKEKWFRDFFGKDFKKIDLLSYYHHERSIEKEKSGVLSDRNLYELTKIVSKADSLSSYEREKEDDLVISNKRLISIFSRINYGPKSDKIKDFYIPIIPLSNDLNSLLPSETSKGKYNDLIVSFVSALEKFFKKKNNKIDFFSFYHIFQKYLWCIPSAFYKTVPDVSLFEHLKSTAAIAIVLYEEYKKQGKISFLDKNDEKVFALLGFDISGIQDFIYTISSKKASQSLKGRSFYIQILQLIISEYLLDKLNYPITNLLYLGGGKGYFIIHRDKISEIKKIRESINKFLVNSVDTKLYVSIDNVLFSGNDLKKFTTVFTEIIQKMNQQKAQKYSDILKKEYDNFFETGDYSLNDRDVCSICGKEDKKDNFIINNDLRLCKSCEKFIKIGDKLRESIGIGILNDSSQSDTDLLFNFDNIKYNLKFFKKHSDIEGFKRIYYFDYAKEDYYKDVEIGYYLISGNQIPKDNVGYIKEFDILAKESEGAKKLGVLRGDVDNLGRIFYEGLGEFGTIGRVSQLSFLLKLFFTIGSNNIFKSENNEYIVYSGGDDFFVIGSWDKLIEELIKFRTMFKKFTAQNPIFTFSAGFSIFNGKYPSYKFAEITANEEERAKNNQYNNKKKDSISFLGIVSFWDDFINIVQIKEELLKLIKNKKISRSYLFHLQKIHSFHITDYFINRISDIKVISKQNRWKWLHIYYLSRLLEREKNDEETKETLSNIKDFLLTSKYKKNNFINNDSLYLSGMFSRWVELLTKKEV